MNNLAEMSGEELVRGIIGWGSARSDIHVTNDELREELLRRMTVSEQRAIAAAIAAEREECAKLAEAEDSTAMADGGSLARWDSCDNVAKAIRNRASQPMPAQPTPKELAGRISQSICDHIRKGCIPTQGGLAAIIEEELNR